MIIHLQISRKITEKRSCEIVLINFLSSLFRKLDNGAILYQKLCRISHPFIQKC